MQKILNSNSGFNLLSVILSISLGTLSFFLFMRVSKSSHNSISNTQDRAIANQLASELLELFASMNNNQLNTYLFNNITKFPTPVPRCESINYYDRSSDAWLNQDPLAALPPYSPLSRGQGTLRANRYYTVEVVDSNDLSRIPGSNNCGATTAYDFVANPDHRYMVSVVVSWIPRGTDSETRAVVSTVLPRIGEP